ncbi:MAG: serine/threonine-protein kinase [Acidobacteriota bacterium]
MQRDTLRDTVKARDLTRDRQEDGADSPDAPPRGTLNPERGQSVAGRYELIRELGRGSRGVVHLAYDPHLDRQVAVKTVDPAMIDDEARERFRREARTIARLEHPHITPVYDFGERSDGTFFLVMASIAGASLRALLKRKHRLDPTVAVDLAIQTADALAYSHAKGIVHRDIKPENVMVCRGDTGLRIKLVDFGMAWRIRPGERPETVEGTPLYLSPEQLRCEEVDGRTDIWALGVLLYEMLISAPPFSGSISSLMRQILSATPASPRARGAKISTRLDDTIMRCLAKNSADRFPDATSLLDELRTIRTELESSPSDSDIDSTRIDDSGIDDSGIDTARLLIELGDRLLSQAEYHAARDAYQRACERSSRDDLSALGVLRCAHVEHKLGEGERVLELCAQGVELARDAPLINAELMALAALAHCAAHRWTEARHHVARGEALLASSTAPANDPARLTCQLCLLRAHGNWLVGTGRSGLARQTFEHGIELAQRLDDTWEQSIARFNLAEACFVDGDVDAALEHLAVAEHGKQAIGDRWGLCWVHWLRARIQLTLKSADEARDQALQGVRIAEKIEDRTLQARLYTILGTALLELGDWDDAIDALEHAATIAEELDAPTELATARRCIVIARDRREGRERRRVRRDS